MKQIKIGTCLPGPYALEWMPHMIKAGFETLSFNYHMTLDGADLAETARKAKELIGDSGVEVSTIGCYCNPLQFEDHMKTLEYCIDSAGLFGATTVSTFAGALEGQNVEAAIPKFKEVFSELAKRAEDKNIKLAIENCPMDGTWEKPTCNIGFNPKAWEMMFNEVPSDNLGLEWEPTHQMTQLIDPLPQLREWVKKIVHMHGKDASVDMDAVRRYGISGAHQFVYHRTPGFGDVDWRKVFTILRMNGYEGDVCIEGYHDPVYSKDWEMTGQIHGMNYLKWARGGEFVPNPWAPAGEGRKVMASDTSI